MRGRSEVSAAMAPAAVPGEGNHRALTAFGHRCVWDPRLVFGKCRWGPQAGVPAGWSTHAHAHG